MMWMWFACVAAPFNQEVEEVPFVWARDDRDAEIHIDIVVDADTLPDPRWIEWDALSIYVYARSTVTVVEARIDGQPTRRAFDDYGDGGQFSNLLSACDPTQRCVRSLDLAVRRNGTNRDDTAFVDLAWWIDTTQPAVTFFPDTATVEAIEVAVEVR